MFGNPETTPGGRALKFYSSIRLDVRRIENIKEGEKVVGSRHRVKVVKNKVAPPFRIAEFDLLYSEGISHESEVLDLGVAKGIVDKSGAWYQYNGDKIGQGREAARMFLKKNPSLSEEIEEKIKADILKVAAEKEEESQAESESEPLTAITSTDEE